MISRSILFYMWKARCKLNILSFPPLSTSGVMTYHRCSHFFDPNWSIKWQKINNCDTNAKRDPSTKTMSSSSSIQVRIRIFARQRGKLYLGLCSKPNLDHTLNETVAAACDSVFTGMNKSVNPSRKENWTKTVVLGMSRSGQYARHRLLFSHRVFYPNR